MKEADESRIKATSLRAIQDSQTSANFLAEKDATTSKDMEDFQVSKEFQNEKADFATTTYEEGVKDARDKVTEQCVGLDLSILNEFLASEEGEFRANTSKDALDSVTTYASENAPNLTMTDASKEAPASVS